MKNLIQKSERLHSLDALRGIMMLLGLIIHSAITYGSADYGGAWRLKDPLTTHFTNDYIGLLIHVFRMPIFFLIAGFFGALLFYDKGTLGMLKNRFKRIVLPFLVFLPILNFFLIVGFKYSMGVFDNDVTPFLSALQIFENPLAFIPLSTFHLWFMYYLILISLFFVGLGLLFKTAPHVSELIKEKFSIVIQNPFIRLSLFPLCSYGVYLFIGIARVETSTSYIPDLNTFLFYSSFYLVGWLLFKSKDKLDSLKKFDWLSTVLAIVLFTVQFFNYNSLGFQELIIINSLMGWLFCFGITGLFIRYASKHSARMRYISDASYWVYLVHLIFSAFLPGLIVDYPIPSTLKFLIVATVTGVVCFTSYRYLVRGTFIGKFLNGKKYATKKSSKMKQAPLG
ncbi:2,3,4,5-tetrahydropyridine-2,6-carboxylate N-succinyltransferase [Flammeovirga pectinis]|uniref:2,3,4,5-tetrahydropyridine-2,6-carboxylate N-succinyltransferase n=1 Tax=Flammeovirga pectinis TaxID=2494373 RepID=A0A3Q9FP95_9BACT|nr:acyltransferase family protein [Flammeovirga pectinis]AZQ61713.1 2,3,4,5-tetrahydropyridine-2,6-carboxylate N-succinyltransferase [Flammeovirga pectinis]